MPRALLSGEVSSLSLTARNAMSQETETAAAPTPTPKSGRRLIIGALIAGSLGGSTIGALVVAPAITGPSAAAAAAESEPETDAHGAPADSGAATAAPVLLNNLVLNPADSRGTRFLLVSVGLQLADAVTSEAFEARETEVRDRVLLVLGTKTIDQLVDMRARDAFRAEIADSVNALLGKHSVRNVYFPQFVIQ